MAWCTHCNADRPIQRQTFEGECPICGEANQFQKIGSHISECRGAVDGTFDVCTYCNTRVFAQAKDKADFEQCLTVERAAMLPRTSNSGNSGNSGCLQTFIYLLLLVLIGSCSQSYEKSKEGSSVKSTTSQNTHKGNQVVETSSSVVQTSLKGIVNTPSGLSLRETPGKDAPKCGGVANMQEFEIIDLDGPEDRIENNSGRWIKIKHKDKVGWVFDGFVKIQAEAH